MQGRGYHLLRGGNVTRVSSLTRPPPGSLGLPFLGHSLKFLKSPFGYTLAGTRQHGHVWKTRIVGYTVVFFAGPDALTFLLDPANFTREDGSPKFIQELLHPDAVPFLDGPKHRTRKRLLLSAFTDAALASYLPGLFTIFERFAQGWAGAGERAVVGELSQLGFDVADFLFAASDPTTSNVAGANDFALMNRGSFAVPINLPCFAYGKAIRARDRLRAYIAAQVAGRSGEGTALGNLKAARGPAGESLPTRELEIELLHFFFAAHGGLTAAIAWLLVVLGQYPALAAALRTEADRVLGAGPPTLAESRQLELARAVSREVLRTFPIAPATFVGVAKQDLEFGGYAIRAGWKGVGALWATLQDGTLFRDPTQFDSTRLADAPFAALPLHAFVPQGGGPPDGHRCAGEALTQLVMPAFVSWFAKRYDLAMPPQDTTPGAGGLGPLPRGGLRITVTPRAR